MRTTVEKREQRKRRARAKIAGIDKKPRLSIFRSNKYLHLQLIDDTKGKVIAFSSTREFGKNKKSGKTNKTKEAFSAGELLAKRALEVNIKTAVLDRRFYKYHGRIKAAVEGIREAGLKI